MNNQTKSEAASHTHTTPRLRHFKSLQAVMSSVFISNRRIHVDIHTCCIDLCPFILDRSKNCIVKPKIFAIFNYPHTEMVCNVIFQLLYYS